MEDKVEYLQAWMSLIRFTRIGEEDIIRLVFRLKKNDKIIDQIHKLRTRDNRGIICYASRPLLHIYPSYKPGSNYIWVDTSNELRSNRIFEYMFPNPPGRDLPGRDLSEVFYNLMKHNRIEV